MINKLILVIMLTATPALAIDKTDSIEGDQKYAVKNGFGRTVEAIEFTPKANKDYTCILVTNSSINGISCFPKGNN